MMVLLRYLVAVSATLPLLWTAFNGWRSASATVPPPAIAPALPSAPSVEQTQNEVKRALAAHSAWSGMALALPEVRPMVPEMFSDAPEWQRVINSAGEHAFGLSQSRRLSEHYLGATDPNVAGLDEATRRALRARKTEIELFNRRPRKANDGVSEYKNTLQEYERTYRASAEFNRNLYSSLQDNVTAVAYSDEPRLELLRLGLKRINEDSNSSIFSPDQVKIADQAVETLTARAARPSLTPQEDSNIARWLEQWTAVHDLMHRPQADPPDKIRTIGRIIAALGDARSEADLKSARDAARALALVHLEKPLALDKSVKVWDHDEWTDVPRSSVIVKWPPGKPDTPLTDEFQLLDPASPRPFALVIPGHGSITFKESTPILKPMPKSEAAHAYNTLRSNLTEPGGTGWTNRQLTEARDAGQKYPASFDPEFDRLKKISEAILEYRTVFIP